MTSIDPKPGEEVNTILHRIADAQPEPPADLWARIEAAHGARSRRRRLHRFAAAGTLCVALVGAFALRSPRLPSAAPEIDWQARAQALELQLLAIEHDQRAPAATAVAFDAGPATSELAEIDRRLQAAYEHRTYADQLVPLWKRRSELLDALIAARKERLTLTRI
ncbi:MAG: hypothetical protein JSS42_09295 [Proteobacteria bacterium]|uniref:hypothetical protein n=1 Tax=Rudaea sp. TaxID=2136325 RepID=UPI0032205BEC|nr:hypothetical protein [Pseudomonadota bacterium]